MDSGAVAVATAPSQSAAISANPEDEFIAAHSSASSRLLPEGLLAPAPNPSIPVDAQLRTLTPNAVTFVAISEAEPSSAAPRSELDWDGPVAVGLAALIAFTCAHPILFAPARYFGAGGFVDFGGSAFVRSPTDCFAFAAFLPALGAVLYFRSEARSPCVALALFKRFAWGWLVLLPATFFASVLSIALLFIALSAIIDFRKESPQVVSFVFWAAGTLCFASLELGISLASPSEAWIPQIAGPRRFVLHSVFSTLGLGTGEAYFWVLYSQRTVEPAGRGPYLARTLISFVVFLIPIQVICSYYAGLGAAHREAMKTKFRPIRSILFPLIGRWLSLVAVLAVPWMVNPPPA